MAGMDGSRVIKAVAGNPWGAFSISSAAGADSTPFDAISFRARAGANGQSYALTIFDSTGRQLGLAPLATYGGNPTSSGWLTYTIPLADIAGEQQLISRLAIQDLSGSAGGALYLDDLLFRGAPKGPFVTRSGTQLMYNGQPFRFVGVDIPEAAMDPNINGTCGTWMNAPETELDTWFARVKAESGARVVRFWAFQSFSAGGTNWTAFDRVVRLAKRNGLFLLPVIENEQADCTSGGFKFDTWYSGGYLNPYGSYTIGYKEYARRVVERYRNESTILAWMLMNEAEGRTVNNTDAPEPLYTFTRDMSAYVKSLDPNHLVTLGVMGGNQFGQYNSNYQRLHALSTIDFATHHDFGAENQAMPGAPLVALVGTSTELYTQANDWSWFATGYRADIARTWQEWTGTVPAGATPFQRIGINVNGSFAGNVYLDQVVVGSHVYDFEDGSTQGWGVSGAGVTFANSTAVTYLGSRSLRVTVPAGTSWFQAWVAGAPDVGPGTPITIRVYYDVPGTIGGDNTLAANLYKAQQLNKPLVVTESGMTTCYSIRGSQVETNASRASKFDAKLRAFFDAGGSGYAVWSWNTTSSCGYDFTTGDPLNAVLQRYAGP